MDASKNLHRYGRLYVSGESSGGTASNGNDTDLAPNVVNSMPGNVAPTGNDFEMTAREDAKVDFLSSQFGFSDSDSELWSSLLGKR